MPPKLYGNVSILKEKQAKIKRIYEAVFGKNASFPDWVSDTLESAITREQILQKNFVHIKFLARIKNGCVLQDTKTGDVIQVTLNGTKITAKPEGEQYVLFALLNPRLLFE